MDENGPWPMTVGERMLLSAAERAGVAFVAFRDADGILGLHRLPAGSEQVLVGRRTTSDVALDWDDRVSRTHAALQRFGDQWAIVDEGLSSNGTFVNEERVVGRRRLRDGDLLRMGRTPVLFRCPEEAGAGPTSAESEGLAREAAALSPTQRRVLAALSRPLGEPGAIATTATNEQIATELHLSVDAVKAHLRVLFRKFGIEELPQNQKRTRLAAIALGWGLVTLRGLGRRP